MDTHALDEAEQRFMARDPQGAWRALGMFLDAVEAASPAERAAAFDALIARVQHPMTRVAAAFATAGGALVESGAPAAGLARAIHAPVRRALEDAARFVARARDAPAATEGVALFDGFVGRDAVDRIAADDYDAVHGYLSLDSWYRPAAAVWSRDVATLREVQHDAALRGALAALRGACTGSRWLTALVSTLYDARLVVLLPELGEAWSATLDGVVDAGQLTVLLGDALREPLGRIGAAPPDAAVVAVMRGEGPQSVEGAGYTSAFHLYPWQAIDPATGVPADDRFEWLAPGGRGSHSLPGDFLVDAIVPLDGVRVIAAVGLETLGAARFRRLIAASRAFSGLRAQLGHVERRSPDEQQRWTTRVRAALAATGRASS